MILTIVKQTVFHPVTIAQSEKLVTRFCRKSPAQEGEA
mgnify:CR=1 FL=1